MKYVETRRLYNSGLFMFEYLALKLVDGLGQLHLVGFRKLRVQTAAHLLLSFLFVLVLKGRESVSLLNAVETFREITF